MTGQQGDPFGFEAVNDPVKHRTPSEARRLDAEIEKVHEMQSSPDYRVREKYHSEEVQQRLQRLYARRYPGNTPTPGITE